MIKKHLFNLVFTTLLPLLTFGQWNSLGKSGNIHMVSDGYGYSFTNTLGPTPATGNTTEIRATNSDWQDDVFMHQAGGDDYGCCYTKELDFFTEEIGCKLYQYQNFFAIYRTFDKGQTWNAYSPANDATFIPYAKVKMINDTLIYSWGERGFQAGLYRVTDNGSSLCFSFDTLYWSNDIFSMNMNGTGYALLHNNTFTNYLFKSTDFGNNWQLVHTFSTSDITGMTFTNDYLGYYTTENGEVFKTIDGGVNWTNLNLTNINALQALDFYNDTIGYVVGNAGTIHFTQDGGSTWIDESLANGPDFKEIRMVDLSTAYATDADKNLYKNKMVVELIDNFTFYPNPSSSTVYLEIPISDPLEYIKVYNQYGQEELSATTQQFDISSLAEGIYYVKVKTANHTHFVKLIKKD